MIYPQPLEPGSSLPSEVTSWPFRRRPRPPPERRGGNPARHARAGPRARATPTGYVKPLTAQGAKSNVSVSIQPGMNARAVCAGQFGGAVRRPVIRVRAALTH